VSRGIREKGRLYRFQPALERQIRRQLIGQRRVSTDEEVILAEVEPLERGWF